MNSPLLFLYSSLLQYSRNDLLHLLVFTQILWTNPASLQCLIPASLRLMICNPILTSVRFECVLTLEISLPIYWVSFWSTHSGGIVRGVGMVWILPCLSNNWFDIFVFMMFWVSSVWANWWGVKVYMVGFCVNWNFHIGFNWLIDQIFTMGWLSLLLWFFF